MNHIRFTQQGSTATLSLSSRKYQSTEPPSADHTLSYVLQDTRRPSFLSENTGNKKTQETICMV
jgi:hypothetical protein